MVSHKHVRVSRLLSQAQHSTHVKAPRRFSAHLRHPACSPNPQWYTHAAERLQQTSVPMVVAAAQVYVSSGLVMISLLFEVGLGVDFAAHVTPSEAVVVWDWASWSILLLTGLTIIAIGGLAVSTARQKYRLVCSLLGEMSGH